MWCITITAKQIQLYDPVFDYNMETFNKCWTIESYLSLRTMTHLEPIF